jgi:Flp pilus assembly protein TadG
MIRVLLALRQRAARTLRADAGSAIIEFIFVAVLVLVPLVYFIVAVAEVQSNTLAVTNAAREAGRAFATSDSTADALERAAIAARLAEQDEGITTTPAVVYVAAGASCGAPTIAPKLVAGAIFTICVTNSVQLPGVPTLLAGRGVTTVGEYVVHVDDFRTVR